MISLTIACVACFFYAYFSRKVLISLGLTVIFFILIILTMFTLSKSFNDWSISVDLCQETIEVQNKANREMAQ